MADEEAAKYARRDVLKQIASVAGTAQLAPAAVATAVSGPWVPRPDPDRCGTCPARGGLCSAANETDVTQTAVA